MHRTTGCASLKRQKALRRVLAMEVLGRACSHTVLCPVMTGHLLRNAQLDDLIIV